MRSRKLRLKAEVFSPTNTTNDFGEISLNFESLGTYYCDALTKPRSEETSDQTLVSRVVYDVYFRYYAALETLPRESYLTLGGKKLEILSISHVQHRNKTIHMVCEERTW